MKFFSTCATLAALLLCGNSLAAPQRTATAITCRDFDDASENFGYTNEGVLRLDAEKKMDGGFYKIDHKSVKYNNNNGHGYMYTIQAGV
jgi:hypothetical protein